MGQLKLSAYENAIRKPMCGNQKLNSIFFLKKSYIMKYVNKTFKNKFQSRLSSSDQIPECEIQPSSVFFCSKVSTHSCTV